MIGLPARIATALAELHPRLALLDHTVTVLRALPTATGRAVAPVPPPPVAIHADALSEATAAGPLAALAPAFDAARATDEWAMNPTYVAAPPSRGFLDGYGYLEPVGPSRLWHTDLARVGFLLLGPGVHYPDHAHPADEVYLALAGAAEWWREDQGWAVRQAGAVIHHPPGLRHAMRCGAAPMLAFYCWGGAIAEPARLTSTSGA